MCKLWPSIKLHAVVHIELKIQDIAPVTRSVFKSRPVFPISAKKCEIFSGIFALKFANSGVFSPAKNRHFCFLPKTKDSCGSRRLAVVCRRNRREKLQNLNEGPFFLGDQHKIGEKDASIGVMTFFFWRSHLNRTKIMRKFSAFSHWVQRVRTISGIFAEGENLEGTLVQTLFNLVYINFCTQIVFFFVSKLFPKKKIISTCCIIFCSIKFWWPWRKYPRVKLSSS